MLYLEDYLESKYLSGHLVAFAWLPYGAVDFKDLFDFTVIEHLPSELRDRFTDIREMDLSVQSKFVIEMIRQVAGS